MPAFLTASLAWLLGLSVLSVSACGGLETFELDELPPLRDAGSTEPDLPDGAVLCRVDRDCADGVACTRDVCRPGGYCGNAPDNSGCSDDVYCNGVEVCHPQKGCVPSTPRRCADDDVCTVDGCDEQAKRCVHEPRDFDGDGEVDWHCFGGTDCDDFDVTRAHGAAELCEDGLDNDCDDMIDESRCGRAEHDRCDEALDVSAGGRFALGLAGAGPDYALSCSSVGARDVAFSFELDEARDVTLTVSGLLADGSEETAALSLRERCDEIGTEVECRQGFPGQIRVRALPAGRYFVIASSEQSSELVLDARFAAATEAPTHTSCASPLELGDGGRFEGDFVDVGDEEDIPCGFQDAADLVYTFTLDRLQDVEISAISFTGERMNVAVRRTCDDDSTTLRCLSAAPARGRLYSLEAGTYYAVVESSPSREVDFSLDVAFLDPSSPPSGDDCSDPLDLPLGEDVAGTLANRQDLVNVVCGCSPERLEAGEACGLFLADVVYRIEVDEPTDLALQASSSGALLGYDFRQACELEDTQLACGNGGPLAARLRNVQPGEYYLVLESPDPTTFMLRVDELPLTTPELVEGNDSCGSAFQVPPTGGLFEGDTLGLLDDYGAVCGGGARSRDAVFELELSGPARVLASLEAVFDTVLYRYADDGSGSPALACGPELEVGCNDDGGQGNTNSLLDEQLGAGTYYYVVDGFNIGNEGRYLLDLVVAPE